jgi:hypothetical protein
MQAIQNIIYCLLIVKATPGTNSVSINQYNSFIDLNQCQYSILTFKTKREAKQQAFKILVDKFKTISYDELTKAIKQNSNNENIEHIYLQYLSTTDNDTSKLFNQMLYSHNSYIENLLNDENKYKFLTSLGSKLDCVDIMFIEAVIYKFYHILIKESKMDFRYPNRFLSCTSDNYIIK